MSRLMRNSFFEGETGRQARRSWVNSLWREGSQGQRGHRLRRANKQPSSRHGLRAQRKDAFPACRGAVPVGRVGSWLITARAMQPVAVSESRHLENPSAVVWMEPPGSMRDKSLGPVLPTAAVCKLKPGRAPPTAGASGPNAWVSPNTGACKENRAQNGRPGLLELYPNLSPAGCWIHKTEHPRSWGVRGHLKFHSLTQ